MIENLNKKLEGKLPVTRTELFDLVSSWGRNDFFLFNNIEEDIKCIDECKPTHCYPLENLDVSQITDMSYIFRDSPFNGDLSKWDISNVKTMESMFSYSEFNNDSIKNWDISNVNYMLFMFADSEFNQDISKWDISNVVNISSMFECSKFDKDISSWQFNNCICGDIFLGNNNFKNKYNNSNNIPHKTEEFLIWFENNRESIRNKSISNEEIIYIDDYLISFNKEFNDR